MPTGCKTRWALALCLTLAAGFCDLKPDAHAQAEVPVALELILAVDTSISIDHSEFQLQSIGLAEAFRDPDVIAAIESTGNAGIAVALVQWGVGLQQKVVVGWSQVRDDRSARALARAIESSPRYFQGQATGISRALDFSARQFAGNGFAGARRVIDISADGRNNSGAPPFEVRNQLVARGITVNGLAILDGDPTLGTYFKQNVIGGAGAFVISADNFDDYGRAIRRKLLREILRPIAGDFSAGRGGSAALPRQVDPGWGGCSYTQPPSTM